MTSYRKHLALMAAAALLTTSAQGGYKLMREGVSVTVAKSGLAVTPAQPWNRLGGRVGRNAESWTLDGLTLNDMTFYGGIANNTTLFREIDKKNAPLPRFSSTMLIPDVVQLFEASYRVANGTSLMSIDSVEPATFAGSPGFRFTYNFTIQNEEVKRLGEARGAIVGGKLYMITFEAPIIYYYNRDVEAFRKVAEGAKIGAVPKSR
jgi:hypothetical protein